MNEQEIRWVPHQDTRLAADPETGTGMTFQVMGWTRVPYYDAVGCKAVNTMVRAHTIEA